MVFVRVGYVYPSRTPALADADDDARPGSWGDGARAARSGCCRRRHGWLAIVSLAFPVYYIVLSLALQRPRRPRARCRDGVPAHVRRDRIVAALFVALVVADRDRRDVVDAAGIGGLQAAPGRRRHVVLCRRRPRLVPDGRAAAATCRSTTFPPISSTRSSRSRITVLPATSAIDPIGLGRARLAERPRRGSHGGRQHADAAARADAVPLQQADLRAQGSGGGAGGDDRAGALQGSDPRAVSQSHLSERRRLRRRDDVAAICSASRRSADAAGGGADRRAHSRAVGAVALDRISTVRVARSHVVLRRMRDEGFITAEQEQAARRARVRDPSVSRARRRRAGGYAKEFLRQQFRDRFGGDHPPDWEVRTTFDPGAAGRGRARGRRGLAPVRRSRPAGGAGGDRSGDRRHPRDGRRSRLSRSRSSIAPCRSRRQPGSAFKPILYAAALEHGYSPVSRADGLGHDRAARARRVGAAQRQRRGCPTR